MFQVSSRLFHRDTTDFLGTVIGPPTFLTPRNTRLKLKFFPKRAMNIGAIGTRTWRGLLTSQVLRYWEKIEIVYVLIEV